jgi:phosphotransferase system IIA component
MFLSKLFSKNKKIDNSFIIYSPCDGLVIPTNEIFEDVLFKDNHFGVGVGIRPFSEHFYSPLDIGTVKDILNHNRLFNFEHPSGFCVTLHIGIDTMSLTEKGFIIHTKEGKQITTHSRVVDVDLDYFTSNSVSVVTPLLLPNDFLLNYKLEIIAPMNKEVKHGDPIFKIIRK